MNIKDAQQDMRSAYYGGGPGIIASGLIWITAGVIAMQGFVNQSIMVFFFGGMLIHPLGMLFSKLLKRKGSHEKGNPLGVLAIESTLLIFIGLFIAFTVFHSLGDWFYSVMLMIIGGRYVLFQTMYGMKVYWIFGLILVIAGVGTMMLGVDFYLPAIIGGVLELIFGMVTMSIDRRSRD